MFGVLTPVVRVAKGRNHFFLNAFLVEYEFQAFDPLIFKYGADLMFFSVCLCHSDFRLHFQMKQQNAIQYLSVLWDPLNPAFTSHSPHQFTHEEVSVSGLWLSREVSRWIPRSSVFSGSLPGVYPGHLTDSRISLLEFLVFALALNGFADKDLWWAGGGRVSPQPLLQQVSSEYMGLEGWLPCLGYRPALYLASLIYNFLADRETIIKVPTS